MTPAEGSKQLTQKVKNDPTYLGPIMQTYRLKGIVLLIGRYSQLIRFARVCSHVDDFNTRNKCLTA